MRLQTSLGLTVLVSALLAGPVAAENCGISYYCYRSMTPGPAPVTPVVTSRPNPNGSVRPNNLQQPRPVNTQATISPQQTVRVQVRPTTSSATTADQRLVEQQRAQTLADQRRLAALGRQTTPTRITPALPQRTARTSTPTPAAFRSTDTQSCSTLALKIKVLESQATSAARSQQQAKAQDLFKVASDLRKQAQTKACVI